MIDGFGGGGWAGYEQLGSRKPSPAPNPWRCGWLLGSRILCLPLGEEVGLWMEGKEAMRQHLQRMVCGVMSPTWISPPCYIMWCHQALSLHSSCRRERQAAAVRTRERGSQDIGQLGLAGRGKNKAFHLSLALATLLCPQPAMGGGTVAVAEDWATWPCFLGRVCHRQRAGHSLHSIRWKEDGACASHAFLPRYSGRVRRGTTRAQLKILALDWRIKPVALALLLGHGVLWRCPHGRLSTRSTL
ncbi:uncharacterized protein LOC119849433 [Dermochelys coriacea]|uniref:uncharacterized protein LOC119849433 n=1 Tax=Dermochelys coriacea TaxID=27794 RepID=UPI001CA8D470|nr:uncharacterized protein LOC119849433 [Dermochelys coriacea]